MALCVKASSPKTSMCSMDLITSFGSSHEPPIKVSIRAVTLDPPQKQHPFLGAVFVVGGGGFEPPKSETSDLQSDAFGHSAIRPN